jgi:hypothetical protein
MKTPFLPAALGFFAAIAAPIQAAMAAPQPLEFDQTQVPVDANEPAKADESTPANPPSAEATANATIALNFDPPSTSGSSPASPSSSSPASPSSPASTSATQPSPDGDRLFAGNSDSIVARTVGAAEGTRTPDGGHTSLYEGHTDPGNGVWNRGTFSYQFGNQENLSAQEADRRQIAKIKRIHDSVMMAKAKQKGLTPLTASEQINGIDMINQAPLAVTEDGGYIERLAEAKKEKGLKGEDAILEARVNAFWDPQRNGWDAPGLRAYDDMGKETSIRHDQQRRMGMISEALESYEQQHGAIAQRSSTPSDQAVTASVPRSQSPEANADRVADDVISFGK